MIEQIKQLREEKYEEASKWDGDTPEGEDEAMRAGEIVELCDKLVELLEHE